MASSIIDNPYAKKQKKKPGDSDVAIRGPVCFAAAHSSEAFASAPPPDEPSTNNEHQVAAAATTRPSVSSSAAAAAAALVISATDKAGMEGIDRARIDAIIIRESGDSLFMQQQRRRDQKVDERIQQLKHKLATEEKNNPEWKSKLEHELYREIPTILSRRRKRSSCVVVDMDMFYMACELLTRPQLNDRPACVGGNMITTSNYVARRYGVRSAMAGWIGDKLVEELSGGRERLVHVPHNFDLYRDKSMIVRRVLAEYDPALRAYSLDEVYLDLAPYLAYKLARGWDHERIREALALADMSQTELEDDASQFRDSSCEPDVMPSFDSHEQLLQYPESLCREAISEILDEMRTRVTEATGGLTCSAGAAANFLLAKIASDRNKPNGQLIVGSSHEDVKSFLYPLPPRKVGGIGRVTDKILQAFSITTVAELYEQRALVRLLFQPASASHLLHASIGCSSSDEKAGDEYEDAPSQKGISRERTFRPGKSWEEIIGRLEDVGRLLSADMQRKCFWARNVCVKVKLHTFDCLSRSRTMPLGVYIQDADDLFKHANDLIHELRKNYTGKEFSVRLLGIRCSAIVLESEMKAASVGPNIEKYFDKSLATDSMARRSSPIPHNEALIPKSSAKRVLHTETSKQMTITSYLDNEKMSQSKHRPDKAALTFDSDSDLRRVSLEPLAGVVTVCCPLCQKEFQAKENETLNRHIDACLNGKSIRQAVKDSGPPFLSSKRKKGCLENFFGRTK